MVTPALYSLYERLCSARGTKQHPDRALHARPALGGDPNSAIRADEVIE